MKKNNVLITVLVVIIAILVFSNVFMIFKYHKISKSKQNTTDVVEVVDKSDDDTKFDAKKKYYKKIKFSNFKSLYEGDKLSVVAVVDNNSNTYDKFIELVNKVSYYKELKVSLIEVSSLSKKDEVAFYDIDDRFSKLESNFFIVVKDGKILAVTDLLDSEINTLITDIK